MFFFRYFGLVIIEIEWRKKFLNKSHDINNISSSLEKKK